MKTLGMMLLAIAMIAPAYAGGSDFRFLANFGYDF